MRLKYVTFTGVDDFTDLEDLEKFLHENPTAEVAILFNGYKLGSPIRFPSKSTIVKIIKRLSKYNLSFHFCGNTVKEVLTLSHSKISKKNEDTFRLMDTIQTKCEKARIQLNFNNSYSQFDPEEIEPALKFYSSHSLPVILQHNKSNEDLLNQISESHHILYDSSGGRGVQLNRFPEPDMFQFTGYAGGIGPDNIKDVLLKLYSVAYGKEIYIDMETKIRTDDKFDLEKCKSVIKQTNIY